MVKNVHPSDQEQLLKEITSLLHKANIPYMVTGALSVIFYGRPRASHDIDFVIEAKEKDIPKIIKAFSSLPFNEFLLQEEAIKDAVMYKSAFNVLHLPTVLKLDFFLLQDDTFDKSRFKRKKTIQIFGQTMTFASPEDTILIKLLWYKDTKIEKHLIDAAFIYQIQKEKLDTVYIKKWMKKQATEEYLADLKEIDLSLHY